MRDHRSPPRRTLGAGLVAGLTAALTLTAVSVAAPARAGGDVAGYSVPRRCAVAAEPSPEEATAFDVPPGTAGVAGRVLWAAPDDPTYFLDCLPPGYVYRGSMWVNESSPYTLGDCVDELAGYCFWLVGMVGNQRTWWRKVFSGPAGPQPTTPPPPPAPPGLPQGDQPGTSAGAVGVLETVTGDEITGWAYDPDTTGPIQVQAYARGKDGQWRLVAAETADDPRDDLGRAAGFRIPHTLVGPATVHVYAVGVNADGRTTGENPELQGNGKPVPKFDCGAGPFTLEDAKALAVAAKMPSGQDAFAADPCTNLELRVHHLGGEVTDDGATGAAAKSRADAGSCKVATDHFVLNTQFNRFWQAEVARYDMVTYFCHDGQRVFDRGGALRPAAIQNVRIADFGRLYQVAYQGIDDAGIVSGPATFNGVPDGAFFTSRPTSWTSALPVLSFLWTEQDSVTSTQVVFAHGGSTAYFGTFGHPES